MEQRIKSLIGFAQRAGKLAIGRSAVRATCLRHRCVVILVAHDASDKVIKLVKEMSDIPHHTVSDKQKLGEWVGRNEVAIIGVLDYDFAKSITKAVKNQG